MYNFFIIELGHEKTWAIQLQKMARGLKFQILEVEGLLYLYCRKNIGTDQLHVLSVPLFSHMQKAGFLMMLLLTYFIG